MANNNFDFAIDFGNRMLYTHLYKLIAVPFVLMSRVNNPKNKTTTPTPTICDVMRCDVM